MSTSPKSLTATPKPTLDWGREGTPASTEYGDIYFSVDGGIAETKAVFLQGCGLPQAWEDTHVFTIGELGFGSGLNFLAAWELWAQTAKPSQHLHFISVEAYPWTPEDLQKALAHWPSLAPYAEQLIKQWPGEVKGVHRLHFGNVHLTLLHMPIDEALATMDAKINAWFLDGFSPSKNPDMWSEDVFSALAKHSAPNAKLATFTVAGHVRRGLENAGFAVEKKPGFGRKRERLEAIIKDTESLVVTTTYNNKPPVIIGGGIAGASIARAYQRRGIAPILIDPEPDLQSAASGNPRALVMPRLDLQDRPESRFFLNAYLYALNQYKESSVVRKTGALQLAKTENEAIRFDKLANQIPLPPHHLKRVSNDGAEQICGLEISLAHGGLHFPQAQTIDPKKLIQNWTKDCTRIHDSIAKVTKHGDLWKTENKRGEVLALTDKLFVTAGANILDLARLDVRFTRGQISWGKTDTLPNCTITYGGYCTTYEDNILLGATHEHVEQGQSSKLKTEDAQENIDVFAQVFGHEYNAEDFKSRAAIRVTTKDTLPISYQFQENYYVMSGLGSRGFMMAPLLGEALVCDALGEPSPLCTQTRMRFGAREKF